MNKDDDDFSTVIDLMRTPRSSTSAPDVNWPMSKQMKDKVYRRSADGGDGIFDQKFIGGRREVER